jgi:hypothetical protein
LKTVVIARSGSLSVSGHLDEMRAWSAERGIVPIELVALRIIRSEVVIRAIFESAGETDRFAEQFG